MHRDRRTIIYSENRRSQDSSQNYVWNKLDVLGNDALFGVFKAYHKTTGEPALVKSPNKAGVSRDVSEQQRELQLVRKLNHKNLVKVLAIEEQQDRVSVSRSIIVMELCERLFDILSMPINRYGLPDMEFRIVLNDVTEGVKYLRENHVVHRDIKPGNIMRCIKKDGSNIYKLANFDGALELEQDAVFMSLYGTEEYLHPDIYEKALVNRRAPANFKAEIDLWSLGATFYHCAAGKTPFKPYHGRGDKVTTLKMIKNKEAGVISGIQSKKDGEIMYSKELPSKSPMSAALKQIIEPVLGKLLERNEEKAMNFEEYFKCVSSIRDMVSIQVLNIPQCQTQKVYVKPDCTFSDLKESIQAVSGIIPDDQFLLTERYIDIKHLENNFMMFEELYVLSKTESDLDMTYKCSPLTYNKYMENRFCKSASDPIMYDWSLSNAMCMEAFRYSNELEKCTNHVNLVSHAIQCLVDYCEACEDSPNRLKINMADLTQVSLSGKSVNLEVRRKDILTTNDAFIRIMDDLLAEIFHMIDPNTINSFCKLTTKTLQHFQSVLTNQLIGQICNKLHIPCVLDFNRFMSTIELLDLKQIIQVLYEIPDPGLKDFVKYCLVAEVPVTYIVSLLEMTKSNLSRWAEICSGSSIDEQLHTLRSKIKEIHANSAGTISEVMSRTREMSNIMTNVTKNMMEYNDRFENDKKQKVRATTVEIMHQLNRNHLETLRKRAFDIASEAVENCNKINKCLRPFSQGFIMLQTLRKYHLEYKQDFVVSEYENNLEQWRSHMFASISELVAHISLISLPVLETSEVKKELITRLDEFEETNKRNQKLIKLHSWAEILKKGHYITRILGDKNIHEITLHSDVFELIKRDNYNDGNSLQVDGKLDLLGVGGFGKTYTYTTRQLSLEITIVIKQSNLQVGCSFDSKPGWYREAYHTERLSHKNIIKYYGQPILYREKCYSVMEFGGTSLDAVYKTRKMAPEDIRQAMLHISSAIDYLHERVVIHRDIRTSNVTVSSSGVYKLIDFGLSSEKTELDSGFTSNTNWGHHLWKSPEYCEYMLSLNKENHKVNAPGRSSDIWMFGVFVLELLHFPGTPQFFKVYEKQQVACIFWNHIAKKKINLHDDIDENWDPEIRNILLRCLEFGAETRADSGELLKLCTEQGASLSSNSDHSDNEDAEEEVKDESGEKRETPREVLVEVPQRMSFLHSHRALQSSEDAISSITSSEGNNITLTCVERDTIRDDFSSTITEDSISSDDSISSIFRPWNNFNNIQVLSWEDSEEEG